GFDTSVELQRVSLGRFMLEAASFCGMALSSWLVSIRARDNGPTEWRELAHARQRIARSYPRSIVQPAPQGFGQPRSGTRRTARTAGRYGEHPEAIGEKRANRTSHPTAKWTGKCSNNCVCH